MNLNISPSRNLPKHGKLNSILNQRLISLHSLADIAKNSRQKRLNLWDAFVIKVLGYRFYKGKTFSWTIF